MSTAQPISKKGSNVSGPSPSSGSLTPSNKGSISSPKQKFFIIQWLDIVARFLGFKKTYNFVLWFIFGGAMFFFCCLRFERTVPSSDHVAPGEMYWYRLDWYRVNFIIHLATILPCGILSILQFIPNIRYKALIFHRINGYLVYTLLFTGAISALMLTRRALGGSFEMQFNIAALGGVTLGAAGMAYYNIKRLQVDQHRKWMLRTMFYMGTIITDRIFIRAFEDILFKYIKVKGYGRVWSCDELEYTVVEEYGLPKKEYFEIMYPLCASPQSLGDGTAAALGAGMTGYTAVQASKADTAGPEHIGTALFTIFGGSMWFGLLVHMICVEIYIRLTPGEDSRLRQYSYQRQLEAGNTRYPGNAGTTRDRIGDPGDYPFDFHAHEKGVPPPAPAAAKVNEEKALSLTPRLDDDDIIAVSTQTSAVGAMRL